MAPAAPALEAQAATRHAWRIARAAWLAFLAALPFSIAGSQIALTLCAAAALAALFFSRCRPPLPPLAWPVGLFLAVSVLSIAGSEEPARSARDLRGLVLLVGLILPLLLARTKADIGRSLRVACVAGAVLAAIALGQYWAGPGGLAGRLSGYHHWLTTAGQLMILWLLALARLLFGETRRRWLWIASLALLSAALAFGFARSAWLGAAAGAGYLLLRRQSRWAWMAGVTGLVLLLSMPALRSRLLGLGNVDDPSVRNRLAQLVSGAAMTRDHPLLGVGPKRASRVYPSYRRDWAPEPNAPHLHNNPMTVAAERGLLGLAAWVVWMAAALRGLWLAVRAEADPRWPLEGALAALIAFLVAGMFEYNFGDSEILMMVYPLMALPEVVRRCALRGGGDPGPGG